MGRKGYEEMVGKRIGGSPASSDSPGCMGARIVSQIAQKYTMKQLTVSHGQLFHRVFFYDFFGMFARNILSRIKVIDRSSLNNPPDVSEIRPLIKIPFLWLIWNLQKTVESNSASPSSRKYCPLIAACILSFHLNATMKSSANYANL